MARKWWCAGTDDDGIHKNNWSTDDQEKKHDENSESYSW